MTVIHPDISLIDNLLLHGLITLNFNRLFLGPNTWSMQSGVCLIEVFSQ